MKKFFYTFAIAAVLLIGGMMCVSAAPEEMQQIPESAGLLYIDIYNPETVVSTTTQSDYVLSGVAKSGTSVSVYYLEKSTGKYKLMYVDGVSAIQNIGASGYYAQRIRLNEGKNNILLSADTGNTVLPAQVVPLEINLLVDGFWDRFKSTSTNMQRAMRSVLK